MYSTDQPEFWRCFAVGEVHRPTSNITAMDDTPGDPRFANDPASSLERPGFLRLNSETLDRTFDSGNMSIHGITVPHQNQSGETSSLDTVSESPQTDTKVKSKVSTYEQKIAQQSEKVSSPERKPMGAQSSQSSEEPNKKPTRAALTRYQSHISRFKLAPSSTSSGISPKPRDEPSFNFNGGSATNVPRATVPQPQLTAEQLPALGMAPFSVSDSIDLQDASPVRYAAPDLPAQPAVPYAAPPAPVPSTAAPAPVPNFGMDPSGSFLHNPASALLLTAALNALTHAQANAANDPNNPLTNAITAASAQILAAALSQAHLQGQSAGQGYVDPPRVSINAGGVPMSQQPAYPSQAPAAAVRAGPSAPAQPGPQPYPPAPMNGHTAQAPSYRETGGKSNPTNPSAEEGRNTVLTPRPPLGRHSPPPDSTPPAPAAPSNVPLPNGLRPKPISTDLGLKSSLSSTPPGMVRTKSLTFSDAGSVSMSVSTFTPPTYRDYLSKYNSGLEAINAVRRAGSEPSPPMPSIGENGSYKYGGANGNEEGKEGDFSHSMDVLAGVNAEKSKPKTLQRNPTILSELTVDEPPPQFRASPGKGGSTPAPTGPAASNTALSKKDSRQMMDVLLEGTDSKNQRLKAEAEYQRASGHYSKLFHNCDPRVFEASFTNAGEHRETDAPSVGSGGHSKTPSKSPYRSTMAQLVANSPRFVKVQSILTPAAGSTHSAEDQKAPSREADPAPAVEEDEESVGNFGEGVVSLHDEYGLSLKDAPTDKLDTSGSDRANLFARSDSNGSSQLGSSVKNSPKKHTLPHRAGKEVPEGSSRAPGQSRKEVENMTASQFMNSSTRGVHTSFRFDHSNKRDIVGRQTNSIRGQGKLHTSALDFVQDQCLNSIDAKNLKAASIKNRNVLVGWQVRISVHSDCLSCDSQRVC
jgi:hypothetical protein